MTHVKPAYLDKVVTKNAISMFSQVKEMEKPMPVTRSGRHVRFQIVTELEQGYLLCFSSQICVSHTLLITCTS
ncbi:unnamed protein product [Hymenolepis diminuta]|uniref:Uncharacterized protein n=1 Tax=Hymenolepis diminuta TaxID=6216 RepID=A0A564YH76_HYMDI|nr:unnamed protein product [Hymenolepis diminuta]